MKKVKFRKPLLIQANIILLTLFAGCSTMSHFDSLSYKETISAKVESLALMEKATGNFKDFSGEIEELSKATRKIYEYEKNRPKNFETTKMWEILLDPDKNLLGGFLEKWKNDTTLNRAFIDQVKIQVEKAYDLIIDLENNKIKKEDANSFIQNN